MQRALTTVVLGLVLALAVTGSASAAVSIGPQRIEVTGNGGRATIERAPFRMSFTDGSGRTVLRQVPNLGVPVPGASADPEPLNQDNTPDPSVYAPLTFEVGGERSAQYPGALYQGNMLIGGRGGVAHSAREVVKAEPSGAGVKLELSTTDPARTMSVTVTPDTGSGIRVQAALSNGAGVASFGDSFVAGTGEAFRGFGGRHNAIDQRGNDFYNWIEQENQTFGPFQPLCQAPNTGGDTCMFPNGPEAAYYVQNLFISSERYGFLLNRTALSRWRMASERPDAWQMVVDEPTLDYTVAVGDAPKAIETISAINGRHRLPPEYAMGPNLKQGVTLFSQEESPAAYAAAISRDLREIERRKLPLKGYSYEGWGGLPRDFVRQTNARLRKMGIHPHGYVRSFVAADGEFFDNEARFNEAIQNGYVAKTPGGAPYIYVGGGRSAVIDFTNPEAVKFWERRIREMLDLGFDGFMNDFGEQVVYDMQFANGESGRTMHNKYPNLQHKVTREITDRYEREHPGRKIFFYTRAGFSGRGESSATYENSNFPGDETTDFSRSSGIGSLAPDALNRGIGGAVGFNTGIGGYFNTITQDGDLTKELFSRWSEWNALSPFYRVHNSCCNKGTKLPYDFGSEETVRIWRKHADLHNRATPLLRDLWRESTRNGMPIMRPLWLQVPGDAQAAKQDQQWMLGPNVLVAPVVTKQMSRDVYFPRGCWESPETDEVHRGPASARVNAPLDRLPYFFRCGTNPFASAAGKPSCLARRSPIGPRNIGRVRLGHSRKGVLRRVRRVPPTRRTRHTYRWCVKRSRGKVIAVFGGKRKRSQLAVTTAAAHGNRRVRPGGRTRGLRSAYPRRKRIGPGLYRANPRSPRIIGISRGRVRFVGVASKSLLRNRKALRVYLKRAGVVPARKRRR